MSLQDSRGGKWCWSTLFCRDEESKNTHIVSDIAVKKRHLQATDGLYGLWWPVWNHFLREMHEVSYTEPLQNLWLSVKTPLNHMWSQWDSSKHLKPDFFEKTVITDCKCNSTVPTKNRLQHNNTLKQYNINLSACQSRFGKQLHLLRSVV